MHTTTSQCSCVDGSAKCGWKSPFFSRMDGTHAGKEPEHLIPKARLQNICPHRFVLSSHGATTTYPAATQPTNRCIICRNLANKEGHAWLSSEFERTFAFGGNQCSPPLVPRLQSAAIFHLATRQETRDAQGSSNQKTHAKVEHVLAVSRMAGTANDLACVATAGKLNCAWVLGIHPRSHILVQLLTGQNQFVLFFEHAHLHFQRSHGIRHTRL